MWDSLSLHQMGTTSGPWSNHYHADISMMVEDEVGKREENDQKKSVFNCLEQECSQLILH